MNDTLLVRNCHDNAAKYFIETVGRDTVLLGTKGYAAPEQYGFGSPTPRTDLYAVGILWKELSAALPVPMDIFDAIIRKCSGMNPSDRMESVQELRNEMEKLRLRGSQNPKHSEPVVWENLVPQINRAFLTKTGTFC